MPETRKPRAGSLQFWPRKRAKRMYPHLNTYPYIDESKLDKPKLLAFAGYKAGMLHVIAKDVNKGSQSFGEDVSIPTTVLDCPSMSVVGVRAYKITPAGLSIITEAWTDKLPKGLELKKKSKAKKEKKDVKEVKEGGRASAGESAGAGAGARFAKMEKQLDKISSMRLIVATQPMLAGFGKKTSDIFEIEVIGKSAADKLNFARDFLGKEITLADVLKEGELVDTIAITKGKGTTGPVKRFGIVIQNRHATGKRRHVGSLGQEQPGRVRWTVPMAGQLGFQQRTEYNKRIIKIGGSKDAGKEITPVSGFHRYGVINGPYIMLEGSVPGPKKRLVFLRAAIRQGRHKFMVPEIKEIVR